MREGGKRGATPSPSFEATHQRRAVPGRSPDSQVTVSQTAFPSLRKQQWPIAVLKHSLLTVARPCGNCTRFPFHSHDCREHLTLTVADASKRESRGQFSEGETARAVGRVFGEAVPVPLVVIYGAGCLPPTGSTAGFALQMAACWIPWQGVNPVPGLWCKGCSRSASQTGGGGGSMDRFRMRAGRPRSQEMPDHSPFEENRRSRAERRRLMRWGVAPGRHAGESIFFSFSL